MDVFTGRDPHLREIDAEIACYRRERRAKSKRGH